MAIKKIEILIYCGFYGIYGCLSSLSSLSSLSIIMGGWWSRDAGSCSSISEAFAFPVDIANRNHESIDLPRHNGLAFHKYVPADESSNKIIIFAHGNCCTVNEGLIGSLNAFADATGMTVYMVEYPGYGENAQFGSPTASSCVAALNSIVEYVTQIGHVAKSDIFIMGHSVGTGVVSQFMYAERDHEYAGLILISPFKSIVSVIVPNDLIAMSSSSLNFYRTHNIIADIKCPIMIVHGTHDNVIDIGHSEALAKLNTKIIFHSVHSDHCEIMVHPDTIKHVQDFTESPE